MNMSYRRAWELLTLMNAMFGQAVAVTHPGRNTKGATEVTPFGRRLIVTYRRLERQLAKAAFATIEQLDKPARKSAGRRLSIARTVLRSTPKRRQRGFWQVL
jgi:molybdate transport repressor ModE-like protein